MDFQTFQHCFPALVFLVLLLQVNPSISDPCDPIKVELAAATKARDDCLTKMKTADDSCETSKVATDLRENLKKKDESLKEERKKSSNLNSELMDYQENSTRDKTEIEQHEKRRKLMDKRLADMKTKLTECQDKVASYGPEDANSAQQEIRFLRNQVKTLLDAAKEKDDNILKLQKDYHELRIRDAICQANYTSLTIEHSRCNNSQESCANDYEIYRKLGEYKNMIISVALTFLACLVVAFFFHGRGHPAPPLPAKEPVLEELGRKFVNERLMITGQGITTGVHHVATPGGQGTQNAATIPSKFDVTFIHPDTPGHKVWVRKIEEEFQPLNVTINPLKPTEYDPLLPPPSTSVIIMSEKPEGSKFFCLNQTKKEYFHIADNEELIYFAKRKYQRDE